MTMNDVAFDFRACMADIKLFCYILGTPIKCATPIDLGKKIQPNDIIKASELKIWKFEIPLDEDNEHLKILNENFCTNISNKQILGKDLYPHKKILEVFQGYIFKEEYIHIIVEPPTTTEPPKTVEEIIKSIIQGAKRFDISTSKSLDKICMLLQQRNFEKALKNINKNTSSNDLQKEGKSNYWYLVSAGAPGIGKTRFGQELFEYAKQNWKPPQSWGDAHFEYLHMDFGKGIQLDDYNCELNVSVIFGLRIAYAFFIESKYYILFEEFRAKALMHGKDIFIFDSVITYYYEFLKLYNNRKLFLYLHIDEFQLIDTWDPFLLGIAPQAVVMQKESSTISFYLLLINAGGLPHALERLLITCFQRLYDGKMFFKEYQNHDYDSIYTIVKEDLQRMYNIYEDVKQNKHLAMKLMYHCVEEIPVSDKTCLDEKNPHLTIENLQRDGHIVLSPCEISGMNLGQLYPGAYGDDIYLQIYIVLKKLHCYEANEQFPHSKKLTNKYDHKLIDLESGTVVVLNGASADFADIILVRMNGVKCLLMIQYKWNYGSKMMTEKIIDDEDIKNLSKLITEVKKMYEGYELITIIFTTQPYSGLQEKAGILIISKDNFDKHFGSVFSSLATFSFVKAVNPNFWDVNRLKNVLDGIGDAFIENVIEK
ncbi:24076_t:CDS:2 [Racocetra persica]|uniref:24076_t:CDS:1 n=1 Tax=Racocetra persica TaxID=160502 RepID=A0ACA9LX14_9GLOM|nr:24076_t:CDS:2 [Racocetra persica]